MSEIKCDINAIQPGDVLLFSYEPDDFISRMIAFLTNSKVSHAAMCYKAGKQIVEETPPQVSINDAAERFKGRTIYIRRLKENLSAEPLLRAADKHVNLCQPYSDAGLYLFGVVLITKKFVPKVAQSENLATLLELCCVALTSLMDRCKDASKLPMTCSHFVAQCYTDAAKDSGVKGYELDAHNLHILNSAHSDSLFAKLKQELTEHPDLLDTESEVSNLKLCNNGKSLYEQANAIAKAYCESEAPLATNALTSPLDGKLRTAILRFVKLLVKYHLNETATLDVIISFFTNHRNMLVSPADLLECNKFDKIGIIEDSESDTSSLYTYIAKVVRKAWHRLSRVLHLKKHHK